MNGHASGSLLETRYAIFQHQAYLLADQLLMYDSGHGIVEGCHHLVSHFHDSDVDTQLMQILRHLQADETTPYNNGGTGLFCVHVILDRVRIRHVT